MSIIHTDLGNSYFSLGRFQEAIASFNEAIRLDPNNYFALGGLGRTYLSEGRYPEGIAAFKKAIRIKPGDANAHTGLGVIYFYDNQYQKAIVVLNEALRLNPNSHLPHHYLGNIHFKSNRNEEATVHLKEAVRLDPNDFWSHLKLGSIYQLTDKYQEAFIHLKEALRIKPHDFLALQSLGLAYLGQEKFDKSLPVFKEVDRAEPNNPHTLNLLGVIYWELGKPRKAAELLERALKNNPDPKFSVSIYANLSEAYEKLEKYGDAIDAAKKALEIRNEDPLANFILGLSYDAQKSGLNAITHMIIAVKGFQPGNTNPEENTRLERKINQKYLARSKKKLRSFYSKYGYSPEDFEDMGITSPPISQPMPHEEQTPQSGTGSGFFVSKLGHVITNAHVVKGCKKVTVGDNANKQVPAEVVNTDKSNDLALLKLSSLEMASAESKSLIQKLSIVVVPLASKGLLRSEDVRLGEKVLVAGYPYGDFFSNSIKVTTGVVSSTRGAGDDSGQFQLDAAVQPGNSGGPIYDSGGNIVGVVISQLDKLKVAKAIGSLPENVNFGIKASTVRQFLISSGLPSKKSERADEKSTEQLAEIAQNQALMVMCHQ